MASGTVLALLVLNNTLFIEQIHKSKFVITAMKMPNKCRVGKYRKTFLDSIGITQASIAHQPYFDLFAHTEAPYQYPTKRYSCTVFLWVFASF